MTLQHALRRGAMALTGSCLIAGIALVGSTSGATTQRSSAATPRTVVVRAPMTVAKVSRVLTTTPDRAGKVKVRLDNGTDIAIPAKDKNLAMRYAAKSVMSPQNQVRGNCGSSYIYVNELPDGHPVHMDTGFDVIHPAISYSWHASIHGFSGSGYDYDYHASGDLAFRVGWHGQHSSHTDYPRGTYAAGVYKDSFALLDNGSVCTSGGPYDDRGL
jgi:hypothetical protein